MIYDDQQGVILSAHPLTGLEHHGFSLTCMQIYAWSTRLLPLLKVFAAHNCIVLAQYLPLNAPSICVVRDILQLHSYETAQRWSNRLSRSGRNLQNTADIHFIYICDETAECTSLPQLLVHCLCLSAAINYWCNMTLMLFCCTSPSYDFWGSKSPKLQSCFEKSNCSCLFPFGYEAGKAKSAHHPPRMAVAQLRCQTYLPNCIREHPRDLWPLRHFIRVRRDKKDKYIWRTPSKSDFSNLWPMSLSPLHGWHNMWTAPKDKDNSWHFEKSENARVFPQIGLAHVDISESWEPQFMTLWPYNTRWL